MSVEFGVTLSSEEHGPRRLVELARMAEEHAFDFVSISDHYHPWIDAQGHSPFVWSVLGAIAATTERIRVGVGVTCPTIRIHPAILAQATATTAQLLPDRFVWGVGSGENLNEHVLGDPWPPADIRLEMLEEAIEVVRKLWTGDLVTHRGDYYLVEDARIYDAPPGPVPIVVSAFGPQATDVAARVGDGLWLSGPSVETMELYRDKGGEGPIYVQLTMCWAEDRGRALETVHRIWPNTAVPGQLSQDLRTQALFEQATSVVTREMIAESVPCGPDPEPVLDSIRQAIEGGADHVYLHQVGDDQEGFLGFWDRELAPAVQEHRRAA